MIESIHNENSPYEQSDEHVHAHQAEESPAEAPQTFLITGRVYSYGKLPDTMFKKIRDQVEKTLPQHGNVIGLHTYSSNENSYGIKATITTSLTPASIRELFEEIEVGNQTIQLFPLIKVTLLRQ